MTESPKHRFLKTDHGRRMFELSRDPTIIAAVDAAILQMQWETYAAKTTEIASALHWQMTGAMRFANIFLTIATQSKPQPKLPTDNLPHEI